MLARAVWWLGVVGCKLIWSSFYDDFVVMSPIALSRSSELTVQALFKLLCWLFAEEGRKCIPFSKSCEALGVVFNLEEAHSLKCRISNTETRKQELTAELHNVLECGRLTKLEAQKLRGRMQFADSQLFGRVGKRCIKTLSDFSSSRKIQLDRGDRLFIQLFIRLLNSGKPRVIGPSNVPPVVVLTDACYERESRDLVCGLGAVLQDTRSNTKMFFSVQLDAKQRHMLGESCKKQIIFEAETLCAVLAILLWDELLKDRKCFLFVDNEGTKFSLMKGSSENDRVDCLSRIFAEKESDSNCLCWLSRVSSHSNLADLPSRGKTDELRQLGFSDVSTKAATILETLLASMVEKMGE